MSGDSNVALTSSMLLILRRILIAEFCLSPLLRSPRLRIGTLSSEAIRFCSDDRLETPCRFKAAALEHHPLKGKIEMGVFSFPVAGLAT